MTLPAAPDLVAGRVYRTRDLSAWSANATRLAMRLVRQGKLTQLAQGLFVAPKRSRFGPVPPTLDEILRAFLGRDAFVITGSVRWNALGLGATAVQARALVYNRKRSGIFHFDGRQVHLRRVAFPENPSSEWFVVDLFENHREASVDLDQLTEALRSALNSNRFSRERLAAMAAQFGTARTREYIAKATQANP